MNGVHRWFSGEEGASSAGEGGEEEEEAVPRARQDGGRRVVSLPIPGRPAITLIIYIHIIFLP